MTKSDKIDQPHSNPQGYSIENRIDIEAAYEEHARSLRNFLLGVLRNESLVADVLQGTFLKLMQQRDSIRDRAALKSWLFQVAYNDAIVVKRKKAVVVKHQEKVAWRSDAIRADPLSPADRTLHEEQTRFVREAIASLSPQQRAVVQKRIYEGMKFREIADALDVPLGTVLARMQSSLKKLRPLFED